MKARCYVETDLGYPGYGGRGITICQEWLNSFEVFYQWAIANGFTPELSIDRIDNDRPYSPENCRWTDAVTQASNTRARNRDRRITAFGETKTVSQWGLDARCRVHPATLRGRVVRGWRPEDAISKLPEGIPA